MKKNFLLKNINIFIIIVFIFLFTSINYINTEITDSRTYYFVFEQMDRFNIINSIMFFTNAIGKMEFLLPVYYVFLKLLRLPEEFEYFIFYNYCLMFFCLFYMINKFAKYFFINNVYLYTLLTLILLCLWFPSYINILWVWRAQISYCLIFVAFIFFFKCRYFYFLILLFISFFFHYSSLAIVFLLIFFYFIVKIFYRFSFSVKYLVSIVFSILGILTYKVLKQYL
jgi:hypothetical protein